MNRFLMFVTIALLYTTSALASESPVYTGLLSNTGAGGYDTVSYFESGQPTKGSSEYTTQYQGATWRFANAENLARFKENPERFAPVYGGYCAWAVSRGYTARIDPEAWKIYRGKLYLNYSKGVQAQWVEDIPGNIAKAESHWPGVLDN